MIGLTVLSYPKGKFEQENDAIGFGLRKCLALLTVGLTQSDSKMLIADDFQDPKRPENHRTV